VLPGVTVTVTSEATGAERVATTNERALRDSYSTGRRVHGVLRASGFIPVRQKVPVEAAVNRSLHLTMEVGGIENGDGDRETTWCSSTPPRWPPGLFHRAGAGAFGTRNYTHLLATTAESLGLPPVAVNDTGSISPSVNGPGPRPTACCSTGSTRPAFYQLGTLDDNIVPAPESIEEVKLQTSLYDASVGRAGGGNFQIVTKGGSNAVKGTGYTFFQHEKMASNEFFADRFGLEKPRARRYEGGFNLGAPLAKDRVFVYGAYQRTSAETGFVHGGSFAHSRGVGVDSRARTAENIVAAFKALNPSFNLRRIRFRGCFRDSHTTRSPVTTSFRCRRIIRRQRSNRVDW
jgi:hypothetical protein